MSQEITPKLAKYLDKFNKLMEADEICPEAKMNEVRILRDLAEEGCYAVSVGDKDYGLDYLDRPFCVDDYPKIKTVRGAITVRCTACSHLCRVFVTSVIMVQPGQDGVMTGRKHAESSHV